MLALGEPFLVIGKVLTELLCLHLIRLSKRFCGDNGDAFVGETGKGRGGKLTHDEPPYEKCSIPFS